MKNAVDIYLSYSIDLKKFENSLMVTAPFWRLQLPEDIEFFFYGQLHVTFKHVFWLVLHTFFSLALITAWGGG